MRTVACVRTTLHVSGRMWRRIKYSPEAPKPRAASTKGRSRALRTTPRTMRAGRTQPTVPMMATKRKKDRGGVEGEAATQARGPHPADSADDGDQEEECLCGGKVQGQESAHGEQQIQPGKRQEEFPAAHQEAIDPTAVKAGEGTAEESQGEREEGGDQAGEQRDLTAIKDAREDVAAKTIAAPKKEDARRGDAEEAAAEQEINGIEAPTVFAEVPAKHILGDAVDEGTGVEAAGGIGKVDVGGWGEGVVAMLFGVIVRGGEGGKEDDSVEGGQEREGEAEFHAVASFMRWAAFMTPGSWGRHGRGGGRRSGCRQSAG